jgi:hypothetical protein
MFLGLYNRLVRNACSIILLIFKAFERFDKILKKTGAAPSTIRHEAMIIMLLERKTNKEEKYI